jgi:hypothetical protein
MGNPFISAFVTDEGLTNKFTLSVVVVGNQATTRLIAQLANMMDA